MKVYVIGDTHFLHNNIVKYCDRPQNHNQLMIQNWVDTVSEDDIIIHLGDIAAGFQGREELLIKIFQKLPGKKTLVRGNHDHKPNEWYIKNLGFDNVVDYFSFDDILFTHYPLKITDYSSQKEKRHIKQLQNYKEANNLKYIVHGHVHNNIELLPNHFNTSVEVINYTPIELEKLLNI